MKGSRYDVDKNGTCGAPACHNVLLLNDSGQVFTRLLPIVTAGAKKLGITFHALTIAGAFPTLQTTSKNIAIAIFPGWFKDYADPLTFFKPLFDGRTIIPQGNTNYSLVGLKPSQAKALGVTGTINGVPSVDTQIDQCSVLAGQARLACYESLDKTLMTRGRAVGSLPVAELHPHRRAPRDPVAIRPVQRRDRPRARRRELSDLLVAYRSGGPSDPPGSSLVTGVRGHELG